MSTRAVVLDTNIIVSAGIQLASPPAGLVELVLDGELLLFTCPTVIEEYLEVLNRPRFKKHLFPPAWLPTLLGSGTIRPVDPPPWPLAGPDADDLVFLALAKQERAVLVTGNEKHYPEEIREGVIVQTPRAFLDAWMAK
ncbi:MAG: putative toxin-antitoxin system toxin component, PIN family [Acidobacteria bacterium]|nr:putative toxin-antitoxin system toxin component, PIN family [Acidobacteriota bacterium]MBS1784427.1 putative toxin-antitoxin system toxin component, PIN family [Acidobacteriota bacterium]